MSWYLTIRRDAAYSESVPASRAIGLLAGLSELRQSGPASFEGAPGMPWVHAIVAQAGSSGNYAVGDCALSSVNVIELVCSYSEDAAWYDALAGRIARALGWAAVEEHEDRQVWPPRDSAAV
ncbi:hypothetical protein [Aquisphaera insulae]|uniref:hypothetical protein n=1 Tax=Aquisphaera insulae TaxID=2712864 RepID=UPI0013E9DD3C|nr:hypothetical protein [Aquisphaera insulae]